MNRLLIYLLLICGLISCKPTVPSQYIQPDDLEDILYDYHLSQAMGFMENGSSEERDYDRMLYFASVLEKHGVTRAEFDSSMVYYFNRADYLQKVYKHVTQRLEETARNMGATDGEIARYGVLTEGGDTTNIWTGNSSCALMPYAPYNRIDFSMKADSSFHKGDQLVFSFKGDFMYQSGSREAVACLSVKLENDSVVSRVSHITVSGHSQLRMDCGSDHTFKEVKGFVYLGAGNEKSTTMKMMFVTNLQLIKFHKKEEAPKVEADSLLRKDTLLRHEDAVKPDSLSRPDSLPLRRIKKL